MDVIFRRYALWLLVLALAVMVIPAAAQENETFTFPSGTTFEYPAAGEIENVVDIQAVVESEDGPTIIVSDYPLLAGLGENASLEEVIGWYIENTTNREIEALSLMTQAITLDERDAVQIPYTDSEDQMGLLLAIRFSNGSYGLLDAFVPRGEQSKLRQVLDIARTFDNSDTAAAASVVGAGGSSVAISCSIMTDAERTVQLRVGPGTNRTSYAFLPAKQAFTPLGQAEADDGSLWFQLDREEVAPNAAAAEAWVDADAVDTEGNCDALGESSAPPIVPISNVPPPASSNNNNQGTTTNVAPSPGTWTITYGNRGKGSCLDNATFTFDFDVNWEPEVVNLSYTGSAVILDGQRLNQISPGTFSGVFTLSNGNSLQFILRPVSSTYFTGEGLLTGVVDGHTCSNTVPLTVTRN